MRRPQAIRLPRRPHESHGAKPDSIRGKARPIERLHLTRRNVHQTHPRDGIQRHEGPLAVRSEHEPLRAELEASGVRVIRDVVPVEEFYQLADCYVFPVIDHEGCVEIPLSVLEAMACGIPVVSRPFGGLRDILQPGDDLIYWDTTEEFAAAAAAMRASSPVAVRSMSDFSWSAIGSQLLAALEGGEHVGQVTA